MHRTKNDLPAKTRTHVVKVLQVRLADAIELAIQAKTAHWNVKGPSFIALHELFDKVSAAAMGYADLVAERIAQLGGTAEGSVERAAERTSLPVYPLDAAQGLDHVEALSRALSVFGRQTRKSIVLVYKLEDDVTVDILTEITRGADQYLWFVESHGQAKR
ncbi:MAG TPA: DNA starvation/stationary phase protection protein Dps [Kiritimatiellia bacterium]